MLWQIAVVVFIAGCIGGSITGLVALAWSRNNSGSGEGGQQKPGRLALTYKNPGCDTVFAGLAGHVLLGGLAAFVNWGLYGPFSGFAVLGAPPQGASLMAPFLTVGQLAGSIVLGIGGPAFLQAESQLRCRERAASRRTEEGS